MQPQKPRSPLNELALEQQLKREFGEDLVRAELALAEMGGVSVFDIAKTAAADLCYLVEEFSRRIRTG